MENIKTQYRNLIKNVLKLQHLNKASKGEFKQLTGVQLIFTGYPLLTFRKLKYEAAFAEARMIWEGETNLQIFRNNNINWWDAWDMGDGTIGETYGYFFKQYNINNMTKRPESRKNVISLWAPEMKTKQPACISQLQFLLDKRGNNEKFIDLIITQRSCDIALGLPYDLAMYYLFLSWYTALCGPEYKEGKVVVNIGSAHIYKSHFENMNLMINEFNITEDLKWENLQHYNEHIKPLLKTYRFDLKI